jgi:type IV pilus assembly protein PilA
MKNKKGFTLTELLAIIVIICVLLAIAIPLYSQVKKKSLEQSYYNVKSTVEVAAEKYASETGIEVTNVDTLVKTGYLPADDEQGNVYDPRNNSILNCFEVDISSDNNGDYKAEMIQEKRIDNSTCDTSYLTDNSAIIVKCTDGGECGPINNWYYGKITLSVDLSKFGITDQNVTYSWTSSSGYSSTSSEVTLDNISSVLSTTYSVVVKKDDNVFKASKLIQVDNEKPIFLNEANIVDNETWSTSKTIKLTGTDGYGSGIKGYYVSNVNENINCSNVSNYKTDTSYNLTENGTYEYCIIDKVGNYTSTPAKFNVNKIEPSVSAVNIETSDGITSGKVHLYNFTMTFSESDTNSCVDNNCSNIIYYYSLDNKKWEETDKNFGVASNLSGTNFYVKARNKSGSESEPTLYHIVFSSVYTPPSGIDPTGGSTSTYYPSGSGSGTTSSSGSGCTPGGGSTTCMEARSTEWWKYQAIITDKNATQAEKDAAKKQQNQLNEDNKLDAQNNSTCLSHGGCTFNSSDGQYHYNDNTSSSLYGPSSTSSVSSNTSSTNSTPVTKSATTPTGQTVNVTIVNGKTQDQVDVGTIVHTNGGDFKVTGGTPGNYTSVKVN